MSGASEVFDLADDFGKAASRIGAALYDTFRQEGEHFAEDWADNAREHFASDGHAGWYPDSITSSTEVSFTGIVVEVGPEIGGGRRDQGFLGAILELGGEYSPAYFDGLQAMGPAAARLERACDATIGLLIP